MVRLATTETGPRALHALHTISLCYTATEMKTWCNNIENIEGPPALQTLVWNLLRGLPRTAHRMARPRGKDYVYSRCSPPPPLPSHLYKWAARVLWSRRHWVGAGR